MVHLLRKSRQKQVNYDAMLARTESPSTKHATMRVENICSSKPDMVRNYCIVSPGLWAPQQVVVADQV